MRCTFLSFADDAGFQMMFFSLEKHEFSASYLRRLPPPAKTYLRCCMFHYITHDSRPTTADAAALLCAFR